jgi:hypothetical protein
MNVAKSLFRKLPRSVRSRIWDTLDHWRWRHPAPHRGIEHLGLPAAQVYPHGTNFDECLREGIAPLLQGLVIRKETPVASIGSCFSDEFASHMRGAGFRYVDTEPSAFPASANWGRVYTIPAFRQIVCYSTGEELPMPVERSREGWFDPLRDPAVGRFPTREEAEAATRRHRAASRQAFAAARVLILTLGQNEAWIDRRSGLVWARRPPTETLAADPDRFEVRAFSFEEDVEWLREALLRLGRFHPELDVLLTVSPVGSYATFCGAEAITQSFAGKCILRAAAERIVREVPRVWYFPSFELALARNPHALAADNRHVKQTTIDRIFRLLHDTVVR